jgi:hypothetical protein
MRQKLRQGPSGLPRGSAAAERRPVSADAISWALHLAPVPAGCGGQPSTACKFRARRPSRPRRPGQHAPVLLRRWLTCQLIWPSLYRGHRVCKFTNLAGGHESRLTPIIRCQLADGGWSPRHAEYLFGRPGASRRGKPVRSHRIICCLWVMSRTTCVSVVFGVPACLADQRGEVETVSHVPPSLARLATSRRQAVSTVVLPMHCRACLAFRGG